MTPVYIGTNKTNRKFNYNLISFGTKLYFESKHTYITIVIMLSTSSLCYNFNIIHNI